MGDLENLRAVIYVRADEDADRWQRICIDHAEAKGYRVISLVVDDGATGWLDVVKMLAAGEADVVVLADWRHLSPDRIPRVEIAELPDRPAPSHRHPRGLRWPDIQTWGLPTQTPRDRQ
jgi:hypothetical protein